MNTQIISCFIYASLLLYVALDGWAQGGITLRNRLYVPMTKQPAINADQHWRLAGCYALTCLCAAGATYDWRWLAVGLLLRLALFDPLLNLRKKDPLFALGTSARLDQLLSRVPFLNPFLRVAALVGSVAVMLWRT